MNKARAGGGGGRGSPHGGGACPEAQGGPSQRNARPGLELRPPSWPMWSGGGHDPQVPNEDVPHEQGEGGGVGGEGLAPWRRRVSGGPRGSLTTQRKAGARVAAAPFKRFVWWCWGGLLFHATFMTVTPLLVSSLGAHRIAPCCVPKHLASSTRLQKGVHAIGLGIGACHAEK